MTSRASTQQVIDVLLLAKGLSLSQGRDAESQAILRRAEAWLEPITESEHIRRKFRGTSGITQSRASLFAYHARLAIKGLMRFLTKRKAGWWNFKINQFYVASPWIEVLNGEATPDTQKWVQASERWTKYGIIGATAVLATIVLAPLIPTVVIGAARIVLGGVRLGSGLVVGGVRLGGRILLRTTNRGIAWYLEAQIKNPRLVLEATEFAVGTTWYIATSEDVGDVLLAEASTPQGVLSNIYQFAIFYVLLRGGPRGAPSGPVVGRVRTTSGEPLTGRRAGDSPRPSATVMEVEIIDSPASKRVATRRRPQVPPQPLEPPSRLTLPAVAKSTIKERLKGRLTPGETRALDSAPADFLDSIVSTVSPRSVEKFRSGSQATRRGLISNVQGEIQEQAVKLTPEFKNAVADARREAAQLAGKIGARGQRWGRFGRVRINKATDPGELTDGLVNALETPPGPTRPNRPQRIHVFVVTELKSKSNFLDLVRERVKARKSFIDRGQVEKTLARLETGSITVEGTTFRAEDVILGSERGKRTLYLIGAPYDARTDVGFDRIGVRLSDQGRKVVVVRTPFRNRTYRRIARAILEILAEI